MSHCSAYYRYGNLLGVGDARPTVTSNIECQRDGNFQYFANPFEVFVGRVGCC